MINPTFELPGQYKFRIKFIDHFKPEGKTLNIEALSHCYANYKILGVMYSTEIMNIIYQFDKEFSVNEDCLSIKIEDQNLKAVTQNVYYRPPKFSIAQNKVGFAFINFVKPSANLDDIAKAANKEKTKISIVEPEISDDLVDVSTTKETVTTVSDSGKSIMGFDDALRDSEFKDNLERFQNMYIQMKIIDVSTLPTERILDAVLTKCELSVKFNFEFDQKTKEGVCEIIMNEAILLGKGCGNCKKKAVDEALTDFNKKIVKGVNVSKQIAEKTNCRPPEPCSGSESDEDSADAELFELQFLNDFYIKNHRNNLAVGTLQEAFQFFKMSMHFEEVCDQVNLLVNNSLLASMPLCLGLSNTKVLLANAVLKHFEKTKWTLMRNTLYINQFDDSVDKGGMYEKNAVDHTKISTAKNVGGQLMLKMGWNEDAGLGKSGEGMKDPIINNESGKRQGLGFNFGSSKDLKSFTNNVSKYLRNWLSEDEDDIIFDRNFDNKERAMVHRECSKLGVTSKSFNNTNGDRFLVVSKYRSPQELLQWVRSKGGKTRLYTLLPPGFRRTQTD